MSRWLWNALLVVDRTSQEDTSMHAIQYCCTLELADVLFVVADVIVFSVRCTTIAHNL